MAVRIGDEAPNFSADTTEGEIEFHDYVGDGLVRAVSPIPRISRLSAPPNWAAWRA